MNLTSAGKMVLRRFKHYAAEIEKFNACRGRFDRIGRDDVVKIFDADLRGIDRCVESDLACSRAWFEPSSHPNRRGAE